MEGAQSNYEHLHRYAFAVDLVKSKRVLDLASGEGYRCYLLSRNADHVVGVEIDRQTVDHATRTYSSESVQFICGSMLNVPIEGQKIFDVIICFGMTFDTGWWRIPLAMLKDKSINNNCASEHS